MTERVGRELVVVGGGPAGVAAALEASRAGVETCLIESEPELGGRLVRGMDGPAPSGWRRLLADVQGSGAEICTGTVAWGIWGRELAVFSGAGPTRLLAAERVILATGAYERSAVFPGSTVPGVMTAGGARQRLRQGVKPGARVLVSGYGWYASSLSDQLRKNGVPVVETLDASARPGRIVVRAEGERALERVVIAQVDASWRSRQGTEQTLEVDALVLAFGWLPTNHLGRLAGCQHIGSEYVSPETARDAGIRSGVDGVLVAGDAGGIVGPSLAIEQGRLAGIAAALDAGRLSPAEADRRARPIQRRLKTMGTQPTPIPEGSFSLADADTIVCPCENVTASQIQAVILDSSLDIAPVIAETRAGMGICQARHCATHIAAAIAQHAHQPLHQVKPITLRPPVVPVPLGALAEPPPEFEPLPTAFATAEAD